MTKRETNRDILTFIDVETFGLDDRKDHIIELGISVTDLDLRILGERSWLLWSKVHFSRYESLKIDAQAGDDAAQYVLDMHTKNNLFSEAPSGGFNYDLVDTVASKWLVDNNWNNAPMVGSSVTLDRMFTITYLPKLAETFHYRIIDTSTLKELCARYNPALYTKSPEKAEHHRVLPDLRETIEEFSFYREEFLIW